MNRTDASRGRALTSQGAGHAAYPERADVVIVGAGFTGLWAAYYLLRDHPGLSVLVLEAEHVGFGASGRNGGWVSALWPVGLETVAAEHGRDSALALARALRETVDEVGRVCADEGIDAGFHKGGALLVARGPAQAERARATVANAATWGEAMTWLERDEARERLNAMGMAGATWTPNCARVHPGLLVTGLAAAVRRLGGRIVEGARVTGITPGSGTAPGPGAGTSTGLDRPTAGSPSVTLADGSNVRAGAVVRATEAWTARLSGTRRRVAPVYSLVVATEPLTPAQWEGIGLADREVFGGHGHVVVYGQRTVDDRLVFGGRGAPHHLGSRIEPRFDVDAHVFTALRRTIRDWLPQLDDVAFTHQWGGPLGIARDWHPSVGLDRASGIGWAGGYVGDGVAASNLAGRTLADLLTSRSSELTGLPWVGHRSRSWEPEPLRWAGINAGLQLARAADLEERLTRHPARLGWLLARLTAH